MTKNLLANYIAAALTALSQIVMIPAYLHFLGPSDWGRLSVVLSWTAALLVVEAGVSLSLSRALSFDKNSTRYTRWLRISQVERHYALVACIFSLAALTSLFYPSTAEITSIPMTGTSGALTLALILAAAQLLGAPYRGVLVGSGHQVQYNIIVIFSLIVRIATAILVTWATRSVGAVSLALVITVAAEALARRWLVKRLFFATNTGTATATGTAASDSSSAGWLGPSVLPLAAASILGALISQLDRILLSTRLTPSSMGDYAIAATLSLAILQLAHPLSQALLPRMPTLTRRLILNIYRVFAIVFTLVWAAVTFIGPLLLKKWVPNANTSGDLYPLLITHLAGSTINVFCVPLHVILLSRNKDQHILFVNALAVSAQLIFFVSTYNRLSGFSGATSWIIANLVIFIGYSMHIYRDKRLA